MAKTDMRASFTAASVMPAKVLQDNKLIETIVNKGIIPPIHAQVIPTNRCNLNCTFCSCRKRNKQDELSLNELTQLACDLKQLGCRAVTITGGGEPLMHKQINEIIDRFSVNGIKVGLVSNGLLLGRLTEETLQKIVWCRISCADDRVATDATFAVIKKTITAGKNVDWAFSYVIGKDHNSKNLQNYIRFANDNNFTHVRVVSDLCDLEESPDMSTIKSGITIDDSKVIYQGRKEFTHGVKDCRISLLRPTIGADGNIYPCCGVQYAWQESPLDLPEGMKMGHIRDIKAIYANQGIFDGTQCYRCYYGEYNETLDILTQNIEHREFL
jgi:organic radical activating enzyme